jgi:hypothetical protein
MHGLGRVWLPIPDMEVSPVQQGEEGTRVLDRGPNVFLGPRPLDIPGRGSRLSWMDDTMTRGLGRKGSAVGG